MRSDCSTGASHVPVKSIKLVATDLASPPAHMHYDINNCIGTLTFPFLWKIARTSPISRVYPPTVENDYCPFFQLYQQYLRD